MDGMIVKVLVRRARFFLVGWLMTLVAAETCAWSDHATLLWPLVRQQPALTAPTLVAEPLSDFLAAEPVVLAAVLDAHEQSSRAEGDAYAPRPASLAFDPRAGNLVGSFLRAIRVNPTLNYGLYRQVMPGESSGNGRVVGFSELSFLSPGVTNQATRYLVLEAGDSVSPAQVVATASDEPDFGMDIGLFTDNGTEFGAQYGFGAQPFGNPNLEYSSQAPFHMGFYHLDWLTRTAQPDLLRTYPEWRISLFQALARHAFATGHDYWGWRFMGWALHYIGDLSQPYHAQPLPGVSTPAALWKLLTGETAAAIQLVSNRHGVLESYQYQRMRFTMNHGDWTHPILEAIANPEGVRQFSPETVEQQLTLESVRAGAALDATLVQAMPYQFVLDPTFEWTGSGQEASIVDRVTAEGGKAAIDALDAAVAAQLSRFSRYAQSWLNLALEGAR